MLAEDQVRTALSDVAALVQADGGDVEFVSFDPEKGLVAVRLILDEASCRECVLPRSMLEDVATAMMRRQLPEITSISVEDPREEYG